MKTTEKEDKELFKAGKRKCAIWGEIMEVQYKSIILKITIRIVKNEPPKQLKKHN